MKQPFYGGYGLIAAGGIPKPSFSAFKLLHHLGHERITLNSDSALATRGSDGSLIIAAWNLVAPGQPGLTKTIRMQFKNLPGAHHASISRVDRDHGDPHSAYEKMGSPNYPTQTQLQKLRESVLRQTPDEQELRNGEFTLTLPANGLALVTLK